MYQINPIFFIVFCHSNQEKIDRDKINLSTRKKERKKERVKKEREKEEKIDETIRLLNFYEILKISLIFPLFIFPAQENPFRKGEGELTFRNDIFIL